MTIRRTYTMTWRGRVVPGDVFRLRAVAQTDETLLVQQARMQVRSIAGPGRDYAGQGWWDVAVDTTQYNSYSETDDHVLSAADTNAADTAEVQFWQDREDPQGTADYQDTVGSNRPIYETASFNAVLPCIAFSGTDFLEDDANAGDYNGDLSFVWVVTIDVTTVADVNDVFGVFDSVGSGRIQIAEDGGFWTIFKNAATQQTGNAVVTGPQTVVVSYDAVSGDVSMYHINADGSSISTGITASPLSGTVAALDQRRIGQNLGVGTNAFRIRRLREKIGEPLRPNQLNELAAEIALLDT